MEQDLMAYHSIDAEEELVRVLEEYIQKDIDQEVINHCKNQLSA